jgi:hypothetical protein
VPAVTISATGSIDLANNAMIAQNTPEATIRPAVVTGYAGGAWNGPGFNSSSAAASPNGTGRTALGYAQASSVGITTFAGSNVQGSSTIIAYTLAGDANLDLKVNALDFNALASNYGAGTGLWRQGDFNYDNVINSLDFDALAQNFNQTLPTSAPALGTLVPEPSLLMALPAVALLGRRRRGQKNRGF